MLYLKVDRTVFDDVHQHKHFIISKRVKMAFMGISFLFLISLLSKPYFDTLNEDLGSED